MIIFLHNSKKFKIVPLLNILMKINSKLKNNKIIIKVSIN